MRDVRYSPQTQLTHPQTLTFSSDISLGKLLKASCIDAYTQKQKKQRRTNARDLIVGDGEGNTSSKYTKTPEFEEDGEDVVKGKESISVGMKVL